MIRLLIAEPNRSISTCFNMMCNIGDDHAVVVSDEDWYNTITEDIDGYSVVRGNRSSVVTITHKPDLIEIPMYSNKMYLIASGGEGMLIYRDFEYKRVNLTNRKIETITEEYLNSIYIDWYMSTDMLYNVSLVHHIYEDDYNKKKIN